MYDWETENSMNSTLLSQIIAVILRWRVIGVTVRNNSIIYLVLSFCEDLLASIKKICLKNYFKIESCKIFLEMKVSSILCSLCKKS